MILYNKDCPSGEIYVSLTNPWNNYNELKLELLYKSMFRY